MMKNQTVVSLFTLSLILMFKCSHLCVDGKPDLTRATPLEQPRVLTLKDIVDQRFVPYNALQYWKWTGINGSGITATGDGEPRQKNLYSISASLKNNGSEETPDCVTCGMQTTIGGDPCRYNIATFSKNFRYYLHSCMGPGVPEESIRRTNDSRAVRTYQTNDILRIKLGNVKLPIIREVEVEVEGGFRAKVRLWLPPDLDPLKKYPLVIEVYGGPDTQNVIGSFDIHWGTYLASSKDMIYGSIDGRGSSRQSVDMTFSVYRNLGTPEVEDQIAVTKHLVETLPFIDGNRTAIWGISYGGYVAAMVLGKDDEAIFKCGISIAPVTSWLLDSRDITTNSMCNCNSVS